MEYSQTVFTNLKSDFPYIIMTGPYQDMKTYGYFACSFNSLLVTGTGANASFKGLI